VWEAGKIEANLDPDELDALATRGAVWLRASDVVIERALATDELKEVDCVESDKDQARADR
jgi:hypothetical protein